MFSNALRRFSFLSSLIVGAMCLDPVAAADVIFNSLGPNNEYVNVYMSMEDTENPSQPETEFEAAVKFTVNGPDALLTSADIAAVAKLPGGNSFLASVYLNDGDVPGAPLETVAFTLTATMNRLGLVQGEVVASIQFSGTTLLESGQTYWLGIAEADASILGWYRGFIHPSETFALRFVDARWTLANYQRMAYRINGEAACEGDLNGSQSVDVNDLLAIIGAWGACPEPCPPCAADLNDSCTVDVVDLLGAIAQWGPCD